MNIPKATDPKTIPSEAIREYPELADILKEISSLIQSLETPWATLESLQKTRQNIEVLLNTLDLLTLTEAQKAALLRLHLKLEKAGNNSPHAETMVGGVLKRIEDIVNPTS